MASTFINDWLVKILDAGANSTNVDFICSEFNGGELEREFDTDPRAGEVGSVPRPMKFGELEVSMSVKMVTKEVLDVINTGIKNPISFQLSAATSDDNGTITPYIYTVKGFMSKIPFGDIASDASFEAEFTLMATYLKQEIGTGVEKFELIYDPKNYLYSVNGVNMLADIKTSLGLV